MCLVPCALWMPGQYGQLRNRKSLTHGAAATMIRSLAAAPTAYRPTLGQQHQAQQHPTQHQQHQTKQSLASAWSTHVRNWSVMVR